MIDRLRILMSRRSSAAVGNLAREEGQTTSEWAIVVAFAVALAVFAFGLLRDPILTGIMRSIGSAITNALG